MLPFMSWPIKPEHQCRLWVQIIEPVKQHDFSLALGIRDFVQKILLRLWITLDRFLYQNTFSDARLSESKIILYKIQSVQEY